MISTWKFAWLLYFSCFVFHINICHSQELFLSRPVLDTIPGNKLIIRYDILNTDPEESFNVSLEISDSKGAAINPRSLTGDIGINISGGTNKEILWNYGSDNVRDEVNIYVRIIISRYHPEPAESKSEVVVKSNARSGLIFQTLALPGLGLSKIHNNKPFWIMGIAGYGCIAGSIGFNAASKANFGNWERSFDNTFYEEYKSQKTASTICMAGAAAIWVTNIVLVFRDSSNHKNLSGIGEYKNLSLLMTYEPNYNATQLKLKFTF